MSDTASNTNPKASSSWLLSNAAGIATLIGAVVGLLSLMHTMGWIGSQKTKDPAPSSPTVVVMRDGPSPSDIALLQGQLQEMRMQLTSLSAKAGSSTIAAAAPASAALAASNLNQAQADAAALEARLAGLRTPAPSAGKAEALNVEFEAVKKDIQELSKMQDAMSNVVNTMHEQATKAIRHIKA